MGDLLIQMPMTQIKTSVKLAEPFPRLLL